MTTLKRPSEDRAACGRLAILALLIALPGQSLHAGALALAPTETVIVPSNAVNPITFGPGFLFGRSVAIDGDTLVVGMSADDSGAGNGAGAVFVFERVGGAWTQVQKIENPDTVNGSLDLFGYSVGVVEGPDPLDDFLIVGAPFASTAASGAGFEQGTAYIFRRSNGLFVFDAELQPLQVQRAPHFGYSVGLDLSVPVNSLTNDLFYSAVVGSPLYDAGSPSSPDQGAVDVYQRVGSPAGWAHTHEFFGATAGTEMGESIAIDGGLILAGGHLYGFNSPGAGFSFGRGNNQPPGHFAWGPGPRLDASDSQFFDFLGGENGTAVDFPLARGLMGARKHDVGGAANSGAAYVFPLQPGGSGSVRNETQKLTPSDPLAFAEFGTSVALDGLSLVVSAPGANSGGVAGGGAIYAFERTATWKQVNKLWPSDVDPNFQQFGFVVALDGVTVVAGMPSNPSGKYPDGAVYIYEFPNVIFADGFESGNTSAWSNQVP